MFTSDLGFSKDYIYKCFLLLKNTIPSYVGITFRSDKNTGKDSCYDHESIQQTTQHPTAIIKSHTMDVTSFEAHLNQVTYNLTFGRQNTEHDRPFPPSLSEIEPNVGLLVIPGQVIGTDQSQRQLFEDQQINRAITRGQPMLAICGGAMRFWESQNGDCRPVHDHTSNKMISKTNEGMIRDNRQLHDVIVESPSHLHDFTKQDRFLVNSVHPVAPNEQEYHPGIFKISARAAHNDMITTKNRQGETFQLEEHTVEAFETNSYVPQIGVMWHPEGYTVPPTKQSASNTAPPIDPVPHLALMSYRQMLCMDKIYHQAAS